MKKQILLRLITFDILVNLLVAAFDDGVFALGDVSKDHDRLLDENRVPESDIHAPLWNVIVEGHRHDAVEDKAARLLVAGRSITILDPEADETYPAPGVNATLDSEGGASYAVTTETIAEGLKRALEGTFKNADDEQKEMLRESVRELLANEGNFDADMATALWQVILFDEIVYA